MAAGPGRFNEPGGWNDKNLPGDSKWKNHDTPNLGEQFSAAAQGHIQAESPQVEVAARVNNDMNMTMG